MLYSLYAQHKLINEFREQNLEKLDFSNYYRFARVLQPLQGHTSFVRCVAAMSEGRVISGSYDKTIKLWDVDEGTCLKTFKGHKGVVTCLVSISENSFASSSGDGTIKVWDVSTGKCTKTIEGEGGDVWAVAWSQQEEYLISAHANGTIKIWSIDADSDECLQ